MSQNKFTAYKGSNIESASVRMNMNDICKVYEEKQRIILLYQYPAKQMTAIYNNDPIAHLMELQR